MVPQFSFWISVTLVEICFSRIFIKPRKHTFELVGTVLNSALYMCLWSDLRVNECKLWKKITEIIVLLKEELSHKGKKSIALFRCIIMHRRGYLCIKPTFDLICLNCWFQFRADFNWVSQVITNFFGFALVHSVISSKFSGHFFNQNQLWLVRAHFPALCVG